MPPSLSVTVSGSVSMLYIGTVTLIFSVLLVMCCEATAVPSLSYSVTGHSILVNVDSAPVTSMTATALATFASSAAGPCTV